MSPQHLWGFGLRYTWAWQVLVLLGGLHILRSAFRRSLEPFELLLFLGAVVFPLRYVRFVAVSAVLLAPLGVWALQGLVRPVRLRTVLCGLLLLSMPLMLWQWGLKSPVYAFGLGLKEGVFPARAVQFLKQRQAEGRLFNTIPAGSYLLWAWPQKKVFIDGRLLQAPRLQQAYEQALREPEAFRRLQEQWGFKFVLSEYNHRSPWRFPLHLSTNPRWALVYFGPAGVVWAIRSPENEALIRRFGYRRLVPSFYDFSYLEHYLREGPQLLQDLRHDVALEPLNQEAHLALAYAAYYLGQKALALEATLKALELAPETAFEHNAAAVLYLELGQRALARRHARRALRLQPQSRQAREILRALR
jgi:tetratricopeptide (TPR) repeat protein